MNIKAPKANRLRSYPLRGIENSHSLESLDRLVLIISGSFWNESVITIRLYPNFFHDTRKFDEHIHFFLRKFRDRFTSFVNFSYISKILISRVQTYNETEWNCFDFVLKFLKFINFGEFKKTEFFEYFVYKELLNSVKYCELYNKVRRDTFVIL